MSVIPAVRGVHRKYLCRFMNMSEVCKYLSVLAGEALVELTGIFDQRRVQREGCRVYVSIETYLRVSETSHTSFVTRHDESCGRESLLASCVVERRPIWSSLMSSCQGALSLNEYHADSSAPPRLLSRSMIWKVHAGVHCNMRCRGIPSLFKGSPYSSKVLNFFRSQVRSVQ
jgi:hypothetical protein